MRANFIHIEAALRQVIGRRLLKGDWAEFGVWHGTTFVPMAELARQTGRVIHAVDSFRGMAEPTEHDGESCPHGSHNVGGSKRFRHLVAPYAGTVVVHEGYVPDVLGELEDVRFAFVHLDLDQYAPTLASLRFVWPRMNAGGHLLCHDWRPDATRLAAKAISDWMGEAGVKMATSLPSGHAWFVK